MKSTVKKKVCSIKVKDKMADEKMCIVPFTKAEYSLIPLLEKRYEISALIAPLGIGVEGQDIAVLQNREKTNYRFSNMLEKGISESDIVIVSDIPKDNKSLYAFMTRALRYAAENGKVINCFSTLSSEVIASIDEACRISGGHLNLFSKTETPAEYSEYMSLFSFPIPVLYVAEMIPGCDGYSVFLSLANEFQKDGKKVLAISDDIYNCLLGYEAISWDCDIPLEKKCLAINNMVRDLYQKKKPDVILIRLPFPMYKFDNKKVFDFGLSAYCITAAIPGDGCIMCSLFGFSQFQFWQDLNSGISSKFGFPIEAIHYSNKILDTSLIAEETLVCIPISEVAIALEDVRKQNDFSIPIYDLLNHIDMNAFYNHFKAENFDMKYGVI